MKPNFSQLQNSLESSSLLKEIRNKIEVESKCRICWELSIGPIICSVCGNNVGCSKCVNQLFTHINPTAKCPLCNAEWKRDPQDSGNTSLWTGHCPNRALAEILNQINQPTCSNLPTIKPSPMPTKPPKSAISTQSMTSNTPRIISSQKPHNPQKCRITGLNHPPETFENDKAAFQQQAHRFLSFRYLLLFFLVCAQIYLISIQASYCKVYNGGQNFVVLLGSTFVSLCAISLHSILICTVWDSFCEIKALNQVQRLQKLVRVNVVYTILDLLCILVFSIYLIATNITVLEFVGVVNMPSPTQFAVYNLLFICSLLAFEGLIAFVSVDNLNIMFGERRVRRYG